MTDYLDAIAASSVQKPRVSETFFKRFLPLFFEELSDEQHGQYMNDWLDAVKNPAIEVDVADDEESDKILFTLPPLAPPRHPEESQNMIARLGLWRMHQMQTHLHGQRYAEERLGDLLNPPPMPEEITKAWEAIYKRYMVNGGRVEDSSPDDILDFDNSDDEW